MGGVSGPGGGIGIWGGYRDLAGGGGGGTGTMEGYWNMGVYRDMGGDIGTWRGYLDMGGGVYRDMGVMSGHVGYRDLEGYRYIWGMTGTWE